MSEVWSSSEESSDHLYFSNKVAWKLVMKIAMVSLWGKEEKVAIPA